MRATLRVLLVMVAATSAALILSLNLPPTWLLALLCLGLAPLALLAPGLWTGRLQSYRVGAILLVFYVGLALTEVVARPTLRWLPALLLAAATVLIALLIFAIRQSGPRVSPAEPRE